MAVCSRPIQTARSPDPVPHEELMTPHTERLGTSQSGPAHGPSATTADQRAAALRARILELDLALDTLDDPLQDELAVDSAPRPRRPSRGTAKPHAAIQVTPVAESSGSWLLRLRRQHRSWLTSALVHTAMLVTLALLTTHIVDPPPPSLVLLPAQQPEPVRDDRPVITAPSDQVGKPYLQASSLPSISDSVSVTTNTMALSDLDLATGELSLPGNWEDAGSMLLDVRAKPTRPQGGPGAQFFGVQATGNRFVFVVDSSTSMIDKVDDLRRELEAAIRRLTPQQQFYVVFFDRDAERMRFGEWNADHTAYRFNAVPEEDLAFATPEHIDACIRWMLAVRLESATNPYEAMAFATSVLQPEAIYLLSDGEFTDGGLTESFLLRANRALGPRGQLQPKIIVHCIAIYSRAGEVVLQRIAAANGGTYRFVDPPRGYVPRVRTPGYTTRVRSR